MRNPAFALLALTTLATPGCATNRSKTLLLMAGGAVAAGTLSAALAPSDERPEMYALLGAGLGAAATGVAGLYLFDSEKERSELERQIDVLHRELRSARDELPESSSSGPQALLYRSPAPLEKDLPEEFVKLVRPGQWSVYRLDHWVSEGSGTMIHQDKMVRLVPAQLMPGKVSADEASQEKYGSAEPEQSPHPAKERRSAQELKVSRPKPASAGSQEGEPAVATGSGGPGEAL